MVPTEDPTFSVDEIVRGIEGVDAAFFGHYHLPQDLEGSVPAFYGGSLFVHQYGEDFEKGFLIWDTDTGEAERFGVPQTRKLVVDVDTTKGKVDTSLRPGGRFTLKALSGSLVKVVVKVKQEERVEVTPAIDELVRKIQKQARGVRVIHKVEKTTRSREGAEKIAGLPTIEDKVRAYFDALDVKPDTKRIDRAVSMLRHVERDIEK